MENRDAGWPGDRTASGEDLRGSRRTSRRRSGLMVLLAAAGVLGVAAIWMFRESGGSLQDVELRSEKGSGATVFGPGDRVRLSLRLARPAAVLAVLQDPSGHLGEVDPPPGDVPLAEGPLLLPRGRLGAWETAGLDFGWYNLWVLAAPEPIPAAERPSLLSRMEEAIRSLPPAERISYRLPRGVLEALGPTIEEIAVRRFVIHGR